jgi:predicted GIY-YIG superfamily endonuclease
MFIVYILASQKDPSKAYIGLTKDLERRLAEHNRSEGGYSAKYSPWSLRTYISFCKEDPAKKFERYLKSGSGHAFLKKHFL